MNWRRWSIVAMVVAVIALLLVAVAPYLDEPTPDPEWDPFSATAAK
jgi:hypothetical protein